MAKQVTDDTFELDVLQADGPVLVDFWAEWCGPCKQIAPSLDEISEELDGKMSLAKVNMMKILKHLPNTAYGVFLL